MAVPAAWKLMKLDLLLAREDTRNQAQRWIEQNVPRAGKVVSEPYRPQMRDASRGERGYEVYRNPEKPPPGRQVLLVVPAHPLRMARVEPAALRPCQGREGPSVTFESLSGDWPDFEFDGIDAFFLPWNHLDRVQRPGPRLRLTLVGE